MSLADLCALVAGRVPLVIEVKSHFDGDRKLVKRMAEVLAVLFGAGGRHVLRSRSGDGAARVAAVACRAASSPSATTPHDDWPEASPAQRAGMPHLRHAFRTRPRLRRLLGRRTARAAPWIARNVFGCPLLTWTVRTPEQRARAARHADQMIFEGFVPGT